MRKDVIHKWCQNLESGEFKQAYYTLAAPIYETDKVGYCCLGLLAETCKQNFPDLVEDYNIEYRRDLVENTSRLYISRHDGEAFSTSSSDVSKTKGQLPTHLFYEIVGYAIPNQEVLIRKNDGTEGEGIRSLTFTEIAAFIREKTGVPSDFSGDA